MGAGVPEGFAVFGVFKGVQIFFAHFVSSFSMGEGIKNTHPPIKIRGGIQKYSTVPPWLRIASPLIVALTGEPGMAFPPYGSEVVSIRYAYKTLPPKWVSL
jgi:hypothetical protein